MKRALFAGYIIFIITLFCFLWISFATKINMSFKINGYAVGNQFLGTVTGCNFDSVKDQIINKELKIMKANKKFVIIIKSAENIDGYYIVKGLISGLSSQDIIPLESKIVLESEKNMLFPWLIERVFERGIF